ncbi:MAG: hypothetical protein H0V29_14250 [Thermoleophilaceae bacterium]|nr:hypothetical protein [Thermoleophilaceae bacterium]
MTTKAEFNAEEWQTVEQGPLFAGVRVVAASRGGTIRESLAIGKAYSEARKHHGESELLDELVASPPNADPKSMPSGEDAATITVARVREATDLVEAKATPEEAEAFKRFVLTVAEAAANAHKEGGFLGVGGERVSEAERKALDELAATLGVG